MPEKTTKNGRRYEVNGRRFTWFPLDDEDNEGAALMLPLRIKLGAIRGMAGRDLNADAMSEILEKLLPADELPRLDDMDVNDFQEMFTTWQDEYSQLTGASLGESASSST